MVLPLRVAYLDTSLSKTESASIHYLTLTLMLLVFQTTAEAASDQTRRPLVHPHPRGCRLHYKGM